MTQDERRIQSRKNYAYKKRVGRCTRCGNMDARTMIGGSICFDCIEYEKDIHDKKRAERNEKQRDRGKRLYQWRKENGICVACGKKSDNGKVRCSRCLAKHRISNKKCRVKNGCNELPRAQNGLCYFCQKVPPEQGRKLCTDCYERVKRIAIKNLERVNMEEHPWRKLDRARVLKNTVRSSQHNAK